MTASDGGVFSFGDALFAFGDASFHGSLGGQGITGVIGLAR
jgi:hypothetical protein